MHGESYLSAGVDALKESRMEIMADCEKEVRWMEEMKGLSDRERAECVPKCRLAFHLYLRFVDALEKVGAEWQHGR